MESPKDVTTILSGSMEDEKLTEEQLQLAMLKYLSKWFVVCSEIWDTKHEKRIDLIVIHKSDMNKKYPVGIEIKLTSKKRGKDLALWLKQASEYAERNFAGFGKCLIITCPQISDFYLREGDRMHKHEGETSFANNIGTFIGQFNVGELQKIDKRNCRIVYKGQMIWDSVYDNFRFETYSRLCQR